MRLLLLLTVFCFAPAPGHGADTKPASAAINALGLDLYRATAKAGEGLLLSAFSIQTALAMAYAGADGATKLEMAKVLHFPAEEAGLHASFAALTESLEAAAAQSAKRAAMAEKYHAKLDPLQLRVANRLFGQEGFDFQKPFVSTLDKTYGAPIEVLDFVKKTEPARDHINAWVEEQTRNKIKDLVPPGGITAETRLVLVNAIYLKAAWADPFGKRATKSEPFFANGKTAHAAPMMHSQATLPFKKFSGFAAVALAYDGGELQFLALVPDAKDGLPAMEKALTPASLAACSTLPSQLVDLAMPKFKMEPPTLQLAKALETLGMKTAFDQPRGSANFARMAARRPDSYLYIGEVFHKTFIALDEDGTEAAAATAMGMGFGAAARQPAQPIVLRLDHPFLFAIQHRPSGACLFVGRITDPR